MIIIMHTSREIRRCTISKLYPYNRTYNCTYVFYGRSCAATGFDAFGIQLASSTNATAMRGGCRTSIFPISFRAAF